MLSIKLLLNAYIFGKRLTGDLTSEKMSRLCLDEFTCNVEGQLLAANL